MSFAKLAEERILRAMREGEFDNLPGRGKPVDLDDYFRTPEHLRVGFALLKSASLVPEEVQVMQEIGVLREQVQVCIDPMKRTQLQRRLNEKSVEFNMMLELRKHTPGSLRRRHRRTA